MLLQPMHAHLAALQPTSRASPGSVAPVASPSGQSHWRIDARRRRPPDRAPSPRSRSSASAASRASRAAPARATSPGIRTPLGSLRNGPGGDFHEVKRLHFGGTLRVPMPAPLPGGPRAGQGPGSGKNCLRREGQPVASAPSHGATRPPPLRTIRAGTASKACMHHGDRSPDRRVPRAPRPGPL
jgi:hypothetical protein